MRHDIFVAVAVCCLCWVICLTPGDITTPDTQIDPEKVYQVSVIENIKAGQFFKAGFGLGVLNIGADSDVWKIRVSLDVHDQGINLGPETEAGRDFRKGMRAARLALE